MPVHSYQDLKVWQKAMTLTTQIYELISKLPKTETYALADQMRRCAVSIPSNIAEGQRRYGDAETIYFCSVALGSTAELETQLLLIKNLFNLTTDNELQLCQDTSKMLSGLIRTLKKSPSSRDTRAKSR